MFVMYYDPNTDEIFQSEMPREQAEKESQRILYAPWYMQSCAVKYPNIPIRNAPKIASMKLKSLQFELGNHKEN